MNILGGWGRNRNENREIQVSNKAIFHQSVLHVEWFEVKEGHYGLNIVSTCPRPYYLARLSGPSLVATQHMMHYNYSQGNPLPKVRDVIYREGGNSVQFLESSSPSLFDEYTTLLSVLEFFPVQYRGIYFLEILHLTCNSSDESLITDCVPNSRDLITMNEEFRIELGPSSNNVPTTIGWIHENIHNNLTLDGGIRTRMQSQENEICSTCDNSWFENYAMRLPDLVQRPIGNNCVICLVGDSHSRFMKEAMDELFVMKQLPCNVLHFDVKFPQNYFDIDFKISDEKCEDVIVALGQWPLSFKNGDQFQSQQDYKGNMTKIADSFLAKHPDKKLIFRSIHYIPLNRMRLSCPPTDWRSPVLVDMYNEILRQVVESYSAFPKLRFVDTSEVIRPIWDTAEDWCHYGSKIGVPEAAFLLNHIWSPHEQLNFPKDLSPDVMLPLYPSNRVTSLFCFLMVYLVWFSRAFLRSR